MVWTGYHTERIPRSAVLEIEKRLERLIEAAGAVLRRHEHDHAGTPCLACGQLQEMIERAREAQGALR